MTGAGLLAVGEIGVEFGQFGAHGAGLVDRDIVIGVAMKDVDATGGQVADEAEGVAEVGGTVEYFANFGLGFWAFDAGVGEHADPAGRGCDGAKAVWEGGADMPGAVTAHGMACEPGFVGVGVEDFLVEVEDLEGIHAAPVFPIEAVGPAVGGGDNMRPGFGGVGGGLADAFNTCAVQ